MIRKEDFERALAHALSTWFTLGRKGDNMSDLATPEESARALLRQHGHFDILCLRCGSLLRECRCGILRLECQIFVLKGGEADEGQYSSVLPADVTMGSAEEAQESRPNVGSDPARSTRRTVEPEKASREAATHTTKAPEPAGPDLIRMYAERHGDKWRGLTNAYWLARLMQEVGELASTLVDDHEGPLEHELAQIGSICWNWLDELSTQASGGVAANLRRLG